jgi:hypothetical protein|tara:strand:- start:6087 stop:7019 length:933 start_codon:yes stop_codon:yes gene_type:complete
MGIKKFFKKNLRDIATVVGFAVGGPAGAAIGQGVGSTAEGRSLKQSLTSAAKVYGGANIAVGAGVNPGTITPGSGNFLQLGTGATQVGPGVGGFFQGVGGALRGSLPGGLETLGTAFKDANLLTKAGIAGTGLAGIGAFDPMETGNARMPGAMSPYLSQGLRPAVLSDVYGTGGIPTSMNMASAMPGAVDPITQTYLELLQQGGQGYGTIDFPEFNQGRLPAKSGGIARLADGGEMPEVDLRESGGETVDSQGSGDEDTIPALLADGEFVMTKQSVKGIGDGDHDKGIAMLYAMMDQNEKKAQNMGLGRA